MRGGERIAEAIRGEVRGDLMFGYYRFVATYHREPVDLDDFFDGMRNIAAENAATAVLMER